MGLPRSGSTLLMNILQQNPILFSTATCPTPYLLDSCRTTASSVVEFIAMKQDEMDKCFSEFIRHGFDGWFSALTTKPIVITKNRAWDIFINHLFHLYNSPKFIVCVRDVRDIICSFEKLSMNYPIWTFGTKEDPVHLKSFEKRMEVYCTDMGGNLGRPLNHLPHVYEWMMKKPNNFFLFKFEEFNEKPEEYISKLYNFLELPHYKHDLNNVQQTEQYEHDTAYRALVSHKTESKLKKLEPSYIKMMTPSQSDLVINHNLWFYETFYPEVLRR